MIPDAEIHAHRTRREKKRTQRLQHKDPLVTVPATVQTALREAMNLEGIPIVQFRDYLWIIAHESGGRLDVRNSHSSARGLFQLLSAQYKLNPHGAESFGNAVEECQGGIRYIKGRYHSAKAAREFWEQHHWY